MKGDVRTEVLRVMDGEKEVKRVHNVYIKIGEEEIKISSGEGTVNKLLEAEERRKEAAKK